jgi:hypothetical protein
MGRNKKKPEFTTPVWATEISVEQKRGTLIVKGKRHPVAPRKDVAVEADLLKQSIPAARWSQDEGRRKKPPHVAFANATTDAKLIEFVQTWGPLSGPVHVHWGAKKQAKPSEVVRTAEIINKRGGM